MGINCCYTYKKVSKNPKIGGPLIIEHLESKLTKGDITSDYASPASLGFPTWRSGSIGV